MASISLRGYNKQIEQLVEEGRQDEAISHCQHILKFFPKHVDTYRLLGKSYLESQQFGDAADIFQRVLSAVPDDFVAHVGMSIIREDEANLDAAIWHMERAFDVQSSNIAIQDELRRLYGKRDDAEPAKIRMTRGALARMYAHGHLYAQSIAELRIALSSDPQRLDLQAMLARMYYLDRQRVNATKISSRILQKLPFCLEANIIISEVFEETNRAEEAKEYRKRTQDLDPYRTYISENAASPDEVPDGAVMLAFDDWQPEAGGITAGTPTWAASLGMDDAAGGIPADQSVSSWLDSADVDDNDDSFVNLQADLDQSDVVFAADSEAFSDADDDVSDSGLIPEFVQDADWMAGEVDEDSLPVQSPEAASADGEDVNLPEWLRSIGPGPQSSQRDSSFSSDNSDWLDDIEMDASDMIEPKADDPIGSTPLYMDTDLPDWVQALESDDIPTAPQIIADGREYLSDPELSPNDQIEQENTQDEAKPVPDWLESMQDGETDSLIKPVSEAKPDSPEGVPDWLQELENEQPEASESADTSDQPAKAEVPDWLKQKAPEDTLLPGAQASEDEGAEVEIPTWFEDLNAEDHESRESIQESDAEPAAAAASTGEKDFDMTEPDDTPHDDDDGDELGDDSLDVPDWLQSLVDNDGAANVDIPDHVTASIVPDWVKNIDEDVAAETGPEENAAATELESSLKADVELPTSSDEPDESEIPDAAVESEDLPEWIGELAPEAPEEEVPAGATESSILNWLEGLNEDSAELDKVQDEEDEDDEAITSWLGELAAPAVALAPQESGDEAPESPDMVADSLMLDDEEMEQEPLDLEALLSDDSLDNESGKPDLVDDMATPLLNKIHVPYNPPETETAKAELTADEETEEEMAENEVPDFDDDDAALAWLENLAAKQGAAEEELLTEPEERADSVPDWLQDMADVMDDNEAEPAQSEAGQLAEEDPAMTAADDPASAETVISARFELPDLDQGVEDGPPDFSSPADAPAADAPVEDGEDDEALAWLENLAAKQGASEEELLTKPEERVDEVPDWLREMANDDSSSETVVKNAENDDEPLGVVAEEADDWLASLADDGTADSELEGEDDAAPATAEESSEDMPSWLTESAVTFINDAETETELADFPGSEEQLEAGAAPQAELEDAAPADDIPDWLKSADDDSDAGSSASLEAAVDVEPEDELPDWIAEAADAEEDEVPALADQSDGQPQDELAAPSWLQDIAADPVEEATEAAEDFEPEALTDSTKLPEMEIVDSPAQPDSSEPIADEAPMEMAEAASEVELPEAVAEEDEADVDIEAIVEPETEPEPEPEIGMEAVPEPDPEATFMDEGETDPEELAEQEPQEAPAEAPEFEPAMANAGLDSARTALADGQLDAAVAHYEAALQNEADLPAVIADLNDAVNGHHPVDVGLWQVLGDAYFHANQLQDALDAYTKAEDLIR